MEKEIKIILLFVLAVMLWSCRKWVEVPVPRDRVITGRVFETDQKASSAMTAVYAAMINGSGSFANGATTLNTALSTDELLKWNPAAAEAELMENALAPENTAVAALWKSAYQLVYYTNAILEGIAASPALSKGIRERLEGECRFLRAFCYFYLVNLFGDVPLVTSTDYTRNAGLPRARSASVYAFITGELQKARDLLPEAYPGGEKNRPAKWAAAALLARVYLYQQHWQAAENEATAVIGSGMYTPLQPLNTVFLKNSKEALWQLSPTNGLLRETSQLRPSGSPPAPQYYLPSPLATAFEPGDNRRSRWLDSVTYLNQKYYYPGKYKNTGAGVTEYYMVLRLAELYLVRAEARMQLGRLPEAVEDINTIRVRAGLPPLLNTVGRPQAEAAIEQEKRLEFLVEWGHRWFDLKRWNRARDVLAPIKPRWANAAVLYPIPKEEIDNNASLTQNPGY